MKLFYILFLFIYIQFIVYSIHIYDPITRPQGACEADTLDRDLSRGPCSLQSDRLATPPRCGFNVYRYINSIDSKCLILLIKHLYPLVALDLTAALSISSALNAIIDIDSE